MELEQDAQPAASDDGDHGVDLLLAKRGQQLIGLVHFLDHAVLVHPADVERVDPGRLAQETPAGRVEVLDQRRAEGHEPASG